MTVIVAGPAGLDTTALDISIVAQGTVTAATPTTYTLDLGEGDVVTVTGTSLTYDATNHLTGGIVTGLADDYLGQSVFQASDFSVSATTLVGWAQSGQSTLAFQTILAGDNTITGGAGADTISTIGLTGSNFIRSGDGADVIHCGTGYNNVNGNKGDDTIVGQSRVGDWLLGGQGNDSIDATQSVGHNIINGNMGDDTVHGGSGGDTLRGGQGNDLIVGGAGNDWISGDLGNNTITTGGGSDTIHAGAGLNTVTDFDPAHDVVLLDHGVSGIASQVGADVHLALSNGGQVILSNVQLSALSGTGWLISS
jgi:Ca2+-binding RTX toxin-like protein